MTDSVDEIYFEELAEQNPEEICNRTSCSYDSEDKVYTINVWGDQYAIDHKENRIECINRNFQRSHEYFYLFVIYYMLKSKDIKPANEWISEKDTENTKKRNGN